MKRKAVIAVALACSGLTMYGAQATEYSFPTGKFVSIERDELPTYKEDSNIVYPVVNYFSVDMPNGDVNFSLRNEDGDDLAVIKQGDRYFINSHIALGENVYFGPDIQNVADPVRVLIDGPINVGHVHFNPSSSRLSSQAKTALTLMAKEMADNNLTSAYLVGMTDRSGGNTSNLVLAEKRAAAAASYLKKKLATLGVMEPVIKTEAMGEYLSSSNDGVINLNDRKVSVLIYPTI
jgi:outer membrane protein OmpA-like peptidoglycan-associated protein